MISFEENRLKGMRVVRIMCVLILIVTLGKISHAQEQDIPAFTITGLQIISSLNSGSVKTDYRYHKIPLKTRLYTQGYSVGISAPFKLQFNSNERIKTSAELLFQYSNGHVLQENELTPSSERFNRESLSQLMHYKTYDLTSNFMLRYFLFNDGMFKGFIGTGLGFEVKLSNDSFYQRTVRQFIDDDQRAVSTLSKDDFRDKAKLILLENILSAGISFQPLMLEYRFIPFSRYHPEIERKGSEHVLMVGITVFN